MARTSGRRGRSSGRGSIDGGHGEDPAGAREQAGAQPAGRRKPVQWKFTERVKEAHQAPIYCLSYNFSDPRHQDIFATVGKNQASVYKCRPSGEIQPLQIYLDEDEDEEFFTCAWTVNEETGAAILLVAGNGGVIRVIDLDEGRSVHSFVGHGNAINDIKVHPQKPELFLTASKDESLRLWNVKTKTCVLIFHGDGGHRNEVLSIDFHPLIPHMFASCGMDNCVKIWSFEGMAKVVQESCNWDSKADLSKSFTTRYVQYPVFSSTKVHGNYVDCVRWIGDLILSKSVDNRILLWRARVNERQKQKNSLEVVDHLQEYELDGADLWFIRFAMDYNYEYLAVGNRTGKVFVYDLFQSTDVLQKLTAPGLKSAIRQTAVSFDAHTILCSCEDSTIYRWDATSFVDEGAKDGDTDMPDSNDNGDPQDEENVIEVSD